MLSLNKIASYESRGPATFITCNYCRQHLRENFDRANGHGFIGGIELGSGHLDDCDAILAGLTVDFDKEQEKKWIASHTPLEKAFRDAMLADQLKIWQEAFR